MSSRIFREHRIKMAQKNDSYITPEMVDFFTTRTENHRNRVKDNIFKISKKFDIDDAKKVGEEHDISKYSDEELVPYIYLTWWYKQKDNGDEYNYPSGVKKEVDEACKRHVETNRHHPESHSDVTKMTDTDIAEMVADWAAMSQEKKDSLKGWADNVVGKKYKFSDEQKELIYNMIGLFE